MSKILLTTRPDYDQGTAYLSYYASLVIKKAKSSNIDVKDFKGNQVNSENITKYLCKKNPELFFINGHGNESSLEGQKGDIIFSINKNLNFLKDKIIYARACHAGVLLGKQIVKGNSGCFIGYISPFSFWIDEKWSAKPSNDRTAALFLEPSNEVINSLIKGNNTETANEKSKKMILRNIDMILKKRKKDPIAMNLLQVLWNNYEGQILHGDKNIAF